MIAVVNGPSTRAPVPWRLRDSGRQIMPIITHILLYIAYATISLTVGLALNQIGGQDIGGSFLGGIALMLYYGYQAYKGRRFAIPGLTSFLTDQGWL